MRVEQQNASIVDELKQSIGPKEKSEPMPGGVGFAEKAVEKSRVSENAKSVNLKDATYNKPEAEEKKTAVEEIEQSSVMSAEQRKNQMAVLAGTTSAEDYARMQEDGFSLDETTTNTIVTETDKIKAQLAKAGVDISFFGDDLDLAQLEAITGSAELAAQLVQAFEKADIPCTQDNIRDAVEALSLAASLGKPGDGVMKYMLDNSLPPTVWNLYVAEFSGSMNYQADGQQNIAMDAYMDQVDKIIQQAGFTVDDASRAASAWLLQNDVPLNEENLKYYDALQKLEFPVDTEKLLDGMAAAIAEGGRPKDAMVLEGYSLWDQAKNAFEVVTEATEEDLAYVIDHGMDLTVRSLEYAIAYRAQNTGAENIGEIVPQNTSAAVGAAGAQSAAGAADAAGTSQEAANNVSSEDTYTQKGLTLLTARRQLEEARLAMTLQANYTLLKKGVQLDTEPLARLVEQLRQAENEYYEHLLKVQGIDASEENVRLFKETTETVGDLKSVPAYVLGMPEAGEAVEVVHRAGKALRDTFERANERYETLMTAPRADLGDSIQKAFRNVDDILTDLGLDTSDANRRAVRILGYNQLEITPEAVAEIKAADEEVQRAFHNLTPATVTEMIRRGVNPLDMNFESLNDMAEQIAKETGKQDDKGFGEFLWKLEKSEGISREERASYIGTYRLIHQVEQSDGAAVGSLVHQGAEITMRNLMMAVRSEHRSGKMDYIVDESFGGANGSGYQGTSITDQIEASYQNNCVKDIMDTLTPERLRAVMEQSPEWENMTPEQLKQALAEADTNDAALDLAYAKERLAELSQSAKVTQDIYNVLQKYDIPNTMSNIMAMEAMVKNRNGMFRQIFGEGAGSADETDTEEMQETNAGAEDGLSRAKEAVLERFGKAIAAPEEIAEAQEMLAEVAENVMKGMLSGDEVTSLDVREMRLLSAQLSISSMLAKDEQYAVPVQTESGVVNVSLKIVRGTDKKGVVDVMMETELHGRIAATFQAKEQGIKGFVATDSEETRELLAERQTSLRDEIGEEEAVELRYAHISDLDLNHFSMGTFGVDAAEEPAAREKGTEEYQVQTARLYHIAESFIRQLRDMF
ncbi:MAG: hypothetical protein J6K53_02020 [Roseburia sp.]|nr:hypothetical protein [Roseburia sp.]